MGENIFAGVDIGSTTSKAVLMNEKSEIIAYSIQFTGFNRDDSGQEVLAKAIAKVRLDRVSYL